MMLIAILDVDFAEAAEDLNVSSMIADVDLEEGKSLLYSLLGPK